MYKLTLTELKNTLATIEFEEFDAIVAISERGHLVAKLISEKTGIQWFSLEKIKNIEEDKTRILLVDDIINSGKSLKVATDSLENRNIKTFAIAGNADYFIYPQPGCVKIKKGWLR